MGDPRIESHREFRLDVKEPGFRARRVIDAGEGFFDPMWGFEDDDGTIAFGDIGGQAEPGWDPTRGHGAVWRMHADDSVTPIVPPGHMGQAMCMYVRRALTWLGAYADQVFFLGQGRPGATAPHYVYRVYPEPDGSICEVRAS